MGFLLGLYQVMCILLYLLLSAVLLYHRLPQRWLRFSAAFFILYAIGSFLFFGVVPLPFLTRGFLDALPYVGFFIGAPLLLGFCLHRGLSFAQTTGLFIMLTFCLALLIIISSAYYGTSFGFPRSLHPYTHAWIEVAAALSLVFGLLSLWGYGLYAGLRPGAIMGTSIIFVAVMGLVFAIIYFTIGLEYLPRLLGLNVTLFSPLSH